MKILITGSNSFIAKSIIDKLSKEKYQIIIKNRHELDLLNLDKLRDFFEEHSYFDYIIHTAAVGGRRWEGNLPRYFSENVQMFNNLMLFEKNFKKLIAFGSGAEFGDLSHNAHVRDLNEKVTLNCYGLAKRYITNRVRIERLPVIILRLWGCFGKYESSGGFIKTNMIRHKTKIPMVIHQDKWMDYIYVNDLIRLIENILDNKIFKNMSGFDCNVTYSEKKTLKDIISIINSFGDKVEVKIDSSEPGLGYSYTGESDVNLLNIGGVGLEVGLKEMYNEV